MSKETMAGENWVRLQFLSNANNVSFARAAAAAFIAQLDCTLEQIDEVKLVISEAVSNCILHGYQNQPDQIITLEITVTRPGTAEIVISDEGVGMPDTVRAMEPMFSTIPGRMGLGLAFIQSFVDELELTSVPENGTRIRMVKSFEFETAVCEV